jgi:hypothetical protein
MAEEISNGGHVAECHPSNFGNTEWFFMRYYLFFQLNSLQGNSGSGEGCRFELDSTFS